MTHIPDEELIRQAKNGDKESYKKLFDKYSGKVLSYLHRYMGDYQKAEDVMVETFLDVYERLSSYREEGKFLSWVYKIATNFAKKEFRRKKKAKETSLDEPISDAVTTSIGDLSADNKYRPDYKIIEEELGEIVNEAISKLDEKYRSVLLLCDVQGLSYEEAAAALKCNKFTVGTRLNRARILFHEVLKKRGYNV